MSRRYWASDPHERDFVMHSSGPWKNHKYLKKIGNGADAVYVYADGAIRDAAGKVVGAAKKSYPGKLYKAKKDVDKASKDYDKEFKKLNPTPSNEYRIPEKQGRAYWKAKDKYDSLKPSGQLKKLGKKIDRVVGNPQKKNLDKAGVQYQHAVAGRKNAAKNFKNGSETAESAARSYRYARKSKEKLDKAQKAYDKTLRGKADKTYSNAKKKVESLLNKPKKKKSSKR